MPTETQLMDALSESIDDMSTLVADIKHWIYGESGMGKTVLGMQELQRFTPPELDILYIDTARGWVSLNNHPELKKRTRRVQYQGLSQLKTLTRAIEINHPKFNNIGAIMFDEISTMEQLDTDVVQVGRGENTGEFSAPSQPDMGVTTARIRRVFGPLLKLPQNIIIVSHIREDEVKIGDRPTGKMVTRPNMMPKLSSLLRGMVHDISFLSADINAPLGGKPTYARTLQVMPTNKIVAKTRIGGLTPTVTPAKYLDALGEWIEGSRPTNPAVPDDVDSDGILVD